MRAVFRQGFGVTHVEWAGFESYGEFNLVGSIINGDTVGTIFPDGALLSAQNELDSQLKIAVYPNPANDELHIMMPTTTQLEKVEIYNALGQLLATHQTADFRIDNLSSGMHVMKITTSEGAIHKNFIKK